MKKTTTLLLLTIGIFTTLSFSILSGGNDPIEGIDIIVKKIPYPEEPIYNGAVNTITLNKLSALADEERSALLAKYVTTIFEKVSNEKGSRKIILTELLKTRCSKCKSFETFTLNVPSNDKKYSYKIILKVKFDKKWISVITDRTDLTKPIENPHNDKFIREVNRLESKLDISTRKKLINIFKKVDFSKLNTKVDVFKSYLNLLNRNTSNNQTKSASDCLSGSGWCGTCDNCKSYPVEGIDDIVPAPVVNSNKPVLKKSKTITKEIKTYKKQ